MQIDNINYLRQHHRHIRDLLQQYANTAVETNLEVISTKKGLPTIQVLSGERPQFIHSKYDPKNEAEKWIDQFGEDIDQYEHVLFYGVGLGYHIEEFMNRHPKFTFSIYEPNIEVFYEYTKQCSISNLPVQRLKEIFIETSSEKGNEFLQRLTQDIQERILLVVLPSYERIYQEKYKAFLESFKVAMGSKRSNLYVDNLFSARWTLNSLINFPKTISTPNILDGFDSYFKDKPLIIVSAGPSLEEEYENLRYIKENKLAYIFAVGSANRALIAQNIMPDAVCTYDPQEHNYNVFASIIEKGITSIPLIFGTSVGFETLNMYQGPKLHMITSQDTIAQNYLQNNNGTPIHCVNDSPTIAAVTFQLAAQLGCNPIMFAGQNLAFKNNQFYSKDVEYNKKNRPIEVEEKDRQKVVLVDDVYGKKVETTHSFNNMRDNIEWYTSQFPTVEVINTTKGGAAIAGTRFQPLEDIIKERLNEPVVVENWYESNQNNYNISYTKERIKKIERSITEFRKLYKEIISIFEDVQKHIKINNENKISKNIVKFDKLMKKLVINDFYTCYIQPVNRTQYQALTIRAANIRKQTSETEKAKLIIESFGSYLNRCKLTLEQVVGSVYKVHDELNLFIDPIRNQLKYYPSDCGVFQYEGEWEKRDYSPSKSIDYSVNQYATNQKGSLLRFRFTGTELKIYGSKHIDGSNQIQVLIDGYSEIISTKTNSESASDTPMVTQILFDKSKLEDREHVVEIKLLDDYSFLFSGIKIAQNGCVLHVDEVTSIEELEIGRRIRCHYKSTYNTAGKFSGLGEGTKGFIPPESSAFPDGDFYFIMVDEVVGEKKLIADRNVQNYISWEVLQNLNFNSDNRQKINIYLPDGGFNNLFDEPINDWDKYILKEEDFNLGKISSWCSNHNYSSKIEKYKYITIRGKHIFSNESHLAKYKGVTPSINCVFHLGFRPMIKIK